MFFCFVCGYIVFRRLPGLGIMWKFLNALSWIIGKVAPGTTGTLIALLPATGDSSGGEGISMKPAFVVLEHRSGETGAILSGESNIVAVASGDAWPSVEVHELALGRERKSGERDAAVGMLQSSPCSVLVWAGDVSFDAGLSLSCAKKKASASTAVEEKTVSQGHLLSASLVRLDELPSVVVLSEYCGESSPSCSIAAVLCCWNDGHDNPAVEEMGNASMTMLMLDPEKPAHEDEKDSEEEDVCDDEQVSAVAGPDAEHAAGRRILDDPVCSGNE